MSSMHSPGPVLVGVGLFAMNTHLKNLRSLRRSPSFAVELRSKGSQTRIILDAFGFADCPLILVPDDQLPETAWSEDFTAVMAQAVHRHRPTHAILSCDPRAKLEYLNFFIKSGIHCFSDKPLSARRQSSTDTTMAWLLYRDFMEIRDLYHQARRSNVRVHLNVQRRFKSPHRHIRKLIATTSREFCVPVTFIGINSSDGTWNFPNEFPIQENHPHKHGYGKLMHSGFHYIDTLAFMLSAVDQSTRPAFDQLIATAHQTIPGDLTSALDEAFYQRNFPQTDLAEAVALLRDDKKTKYGEVDLFAHLSLMSQGRVRTTASLNLLSTGFSRRSSSALPFDTYRKNGRVRHESIDIQLGPLMKISFQEFQVSKDAKKPNLHLGPRVLIFRNQDLIGGAAVEEMSFAASTGPTGHAEDQRRQVLEDFLNDNLDDADLDEFDFSMYLTAFLSATIANRVCDSRDVQSALGISVPPLAISAEGRFLNPIREATL